MKSLSTSICRMNTLKDKIRSVSSKIRIGDHNTLQNRKIKQLSSEDLFKFTLLARVLDNSPSDFHIEVTSVRKKEIDVLVIKPVEVSDSIVIGLTELRLKKEVITIPNIF